MSQKISNGVVHTVPQDLKKVLLSSDKISSAWSVLTPLARNEWICWVISVKKTETREKHIERLREDILKGKKRPCCWAGCVHR